MSKTGRNDPCPCGSGRKYKQCCLLREGIPASNKPAIISAIPQAIQEAVTHHQAGRLSQAEVIYRQILQAKPDHPDALHLLGMVAHEAGSDEIAVELIGRAIRLNPSEAMYHNNLGMALETQGNLDAAAESFNHALLLRPGYARAHYNLGNILREQDQLDAAAASYYQAIASQPDYAEAHNNLGNLLKDQGKLDEAVAHYNQALALKSDYAEAYNNLGNVRKDQGKLDEAVEHYKKAIACQPDYAEAHNNLGFVFQSRVELDTAAGYFRKAIALKPDLAEAHYNLGNVFLAQNKLEAAISFYRSVLELKPDYAEAHNNLGAALQGQNKLEAAVSSYRSALKLQPDYAEAHNNLGVAVQGQGKLDEAIASFQRALAIKPDYAEAYSNLLFLHAYHYVLDAREYFSLARGWEQACIPAPDRHLAQHRMFQCAPLVGRRLRVGYVSGDYRRHPVSYFIEQLFACHGRGRVELFAYSASGIRDAVTERLRSLVGQWIPVAGMSDAAVRDRIEADGIDVLVDLSGHTAHNRMGVFARRAAPVQAHYLGYFASTGLTEMDYWIGDEILTPAETDSHFCEQVWRLPRVWVSYKTLAAAPEPDWRSNSDGVVWLGSFNNLGKLTPATLALWARILHALPEARLLLKTSELADDGNRRRILDAMAGHGVAPDRIELQRETDWGDYMAQYNRLDIALDPVGGHGGGTTTCDALWMGVPVIHALGECATSRFTATMLNAIGHPEWIARSEAEYVDKVVTLARDVELRKALRSGQREKMAASPLCNAKDLTLSLENAYFEMFERWLENQGRQTPQACAIS